MSLIPRLLLHLSCSSPGTSSNFSLVFILATKIKRTISGSTDDQHYLLTIFLNECPYCLQETLHPEVDIVNLEDNASAMIQNLGLAIFEMGNLALKVLNKEYEIWLRLYESHEMKFTFSRLWRAFILTLSNKVEKKQEFE